MTIQENDGATAARRAHVEALLAAYPDVTPEERSLLVRYFKRDANALDVGLIASNADITDGYRRFRDDHLDRFTARDLVKGIVGLAAMAMCVGLIMFRAF
jgi:hypothetical protein